MLRNHDKIKSRWGKRI